MTKRDTLAALALILAPLSAAHAAGPDPAQAVPPLVAAGIGLTAFLVWGRATFPKAAQAAARAAAANSAWRTFWVGLVNASCAFLVAVALGKLGEAFAPIGLLAVAVLGAVAALCFRGALALWPEYGYRLLGRDAEPTELQATLAGGAFLTATLLLFPIGELFVAYVLVRCLGVSVLAWLAGRSRPAPSPASVEPAAPAA
jgi:hypothetical protein